MKRWWKPPRLRINQDEEERHATQLELFYDLIFVAAVAELAQALNRNISWLGFLGFVVLFVPIWWSWIGTIYYNNRFEINNLGHRLLTVLQILAAVTLAANVHNAWGGSSAGFALAYAAGRMVLVAKYARSIRPIPEARSLTTRYACGFGLAALIWLVSAFVPTPLRFGLWFVGLVVDFATPLSAGKLHAEMAPNASHLSERLGQFTLIVIGESVVEVIQGVARERWSLPSAIAAVFGLCIAFSFWWIYFDNSDGSVIMTTRNTGRVGLYQVWLYTHLLLVIGITGTAVGVQHLVLSDQSKMLLSANQWLVCGNVAFSLLALGVLHLTTVTARTKPNSVIQMIGRLGSVILALAPNLFGINLLPVQLIGFLAVVCAIQVALELLVIWKSEN